MKSNSNALTITVLFVFLYLLFLENFCKMGASMTPSHIHTFITIWSHKSALYIPLQHSYPVLVPSNFLNSILLLVD